MTSLQFGAFLLGMVCFGGCTEAMALAPCANNPAGAVRAFEGEGFQADPDGYRVVRMHRDVVLGTRWASVERCGHPEWPGMSLSLGRYGSTGDAEAVAVSPAQRLPLPMVVRPGETVRLWSHDSNVRLEMAAVSEEGGAAGDRIRVRVTTRQEYGEVVRYVYGLVRGPADVEMAQ